MSFPTYEHYKDSSVPWLGELPGHWKVLRLKYACEVFPSNVDKHAREDESAVRLCNYTDVYYSDRITADMPFMEATATDEQIARFTLRGGDTIVTKDSETADDIAIAAYVPGDLPGVVCGYHLSMVRPRGSTSGAFVKRLFDSFYAKARFAVAANGLTRVGLGQYALDNVEFPFPPPDEQQSIAAFLDRETAKIDALVEEQKRLIELLKEKRQAVISQAVTKGLDPNAPMKDSGVEWLGKVPAHWAVGALGYLAAIDSGATPARDIPEYWNGSIPWIKTAEVNYEAITAAEEHITELGLTSSSARLASPGTLLMAMYGQGATRGRVSILSVEAAYNQACAAIRFRDVLRPQFGYYFFLAAYEHVRDSGNETSQMNLSTGVISKFKLPVPTLVEQDAIVCFLDQQLHAIDGLLAEAEAAERLLAERRSALISAAVTGKIDVRALAPRPHGEKSPLAHDESHDLQCG